MTSTNEMRNMIAFMRLNARNFDDGVGNEAPTYLAKALDMFEHAVNQLDAVPVEAIIAYRANSDESEGLIRYGNHEAHVDFAQAMETLDAWLETQVTP